MVDRHATTGPASAAAAEADLLARLRAGDDDAYEQLVREVGPRLLAVARRITRTEADAEDAVQDAFVSAFGAIADFDGRSTLSTWLHRIVVNAALTKLRRIRADRAVNIEPLLPVFEGGLHREHPKRWPGAGPGDHSEDRDAPLDAAVIWRALDQLPDEYRTVLVLRDIEGLDSKAVAASLEISDSLVRQRLHRGRQALMRLLDPVMTERRP